MGSFLHPHASAFSPPGEPTMQGSVRSLARSPLGGVCSGRVRAALLGPSRRRLLLLPSTRTLFSETGVWEKVYQPETRRRVEEWWRPRIMARWRESLEQVRRSFTVCGLSQGCTLRAEMMNARIPEQSYFRVL